MNIVKRYWFGYVLEKVNTSYEIISEKEVPRICWNIFGDQIVSYTYQRIAWHKFIPGDAISSSFKTEKECLDYQTYYNKMQRVYAKH